MQINPEKPFELRLFILWFSELMVVYRSKIPHIYAVVHNNFWVNGRLWNDEEHRQAKVVVVYEVSHFMNDV